MLRQSLIVVSVAALAFAAGRAWPGGDTALAAQPEKKPAPATQPDKKPGDAKPGQPGAQPDKKPDPAMEQMMARMQPGEHHKVLEAMAGNWEGHVKFWMTPGGEPSESTGKIRREMGLDGRFLIEHVEGQSQGQPPFKAMGIVGYNTLENKYESVWVENMATWVTLMTGTHDAAKKSMTFEGDALDPTTGKRAHARHTVDLSNPNRHTMTGYCKGPDGKEFKNFEGVFERKK